MNRLERRRQVRRDPATSDVGRFRGVLVAAAVACACVVLGMALSLGSPSLGSPGSLSSSHIRANLACTDCHAARAPEQTCPTCHGERASLHFGHEQLRSAGRLTCASCHTAHNPSEVSFSPEGRITLRNVASSVEARSGPFRPAARTTVQLVPASSCMRCHDGSRSNDPVQRCLPHGAASDFASAPVLCFDEHRSPASVARVSTRSRASASRDAATNAVAELVAQGGISVHRATPWLGWSCTGAGLAVGFALFGGLARWQRKRERERQKARAPELPKEIDRVRLPQIDESKCLGCYACVDACPYDVLEIRRYVAVVARPAACCGLTTCQERCPNGSLVVRTGAPRQLGPRANGDLESLEVPGIFFAGDLTGTPLIRNAMLQGERVMRQIAARSARRSTQAWDVIIVGAGPAGLSAALEAKAQGLRARIFEQASVAESIRSFPRAKLVLDHASAKTRLWLEECTKEELLRRWQRAVRRERLDIVENARVTRVARRPAGFAVSVRSVDGEVREHDARAIVVATGRRGSPRKLLVPIPEAAQSRVHYSLADAASFSQKRVVIVGLGDVALEAAIALARQPDVSVHVLARGAAFTRGKARNVSEVERLCQSGRIELHWESQISAVNAETIRVRGPRGEFELGYDAVFVLIGATPTWDLLEASGITPPTESG